MALERTTSVASGQITGTSGSSGNVSQAAPFATNQPCVWLYLQSPSSNSGTITISSVASATGGLVLPAGAGNNQPYMIGPMLKLDFLNVQFSHAGDVLNWVALY